MPLWWVMSARQISIRSFSFFYRLRKRLGGLDVADMIGQDMSPGRGQPRRYRPADTAGAPRDDDILSGQRK